MRASKTKWNITVIADADHEIVAQAICRRLMNAWDISPGAIITSGRLDELTEAMVRELDAVVLIIDSASSHAQFLRPLAYLEDWHVPVLALLDEPPRPSNIFEHSGTLVDDRETSGPILCARLHGMLHRQREINRLWREMAVARRTYGGLHGEVNKIHEELHLAAVAQRERLPQEPISLHGVTTAALWRPAHFVSGDIYDIIRLDEDHLGLFIADAVGHGIAAALMTMVILQSLTTSEPDGSSIRILQPKEVLQRLNAQMIRHRGLPTRFATSAYAVINCRSRRLTLAGAGHPAPLLVHSDGRSVALETSGGLLGVFSDEVYDELDVELELGDHLLLYSDGFEQAFPQVRRDDASEDLPNTRYRQEFEQLCALSSPQEMISTISRRLNLQSGSLHQADDLTLLCVHAGQLAAEDQKLQVKNQEVSAKP